MTTNHLNLASKSLANNSTYAKKRELFIKAVLALGEEDLAEDLVRAESRLESFYQKEHPDRTTQELEFYLITRPLQKILDTPIHKERIHAGETPWTDPIDPRFYIVDYLSFLSVIDRVENLSEKYAKIADSFYGEIYQVSQKCFLHGDIIILPAKIISIKGIKKGVSDFRD